MSPLTPRAPNPALAEHPEFALMLLATLERFHCTLAEVREDYWLGRAWRALTGDPALSGRVARVGVGGALIAGPGFGPAPQSHTERALLELRVADRLVVDTGHIAESLGIAVQFAEGPVKVAEGCVLSLLAQTVAYDARWHDLPLYAGDLSPVIVPVAYSVAASAAA